MEIGKIVEKIANVLDSVKLPADTLPPILLKCVSMNRPGLSAYKITTKIIENNKLLGIPTENNSDGSANLINQYTYNVVKNIVDAFQNDASVHVAIPMESLMIQVTGGNAGGPITATGTNLLDSISKGIIK